MNDIYVVIKYYLIIIDSYYTKFHVYFKYISCISHVYYEKKHNSYFHF